MTEPRETHAIHTEGDVLHVVLRGEIDVASAPVIQADVSAAMDGQPRLVVDLSDVTFFDSSGVHLLDTVAGAAEAAGTEVRVVAPDGSPARYVLRICAFREDLVVSSLDD